MPFRRGISAACSRAAASRPGRGCAPANCVGVIDADYRGECTVALHNDTDAPRTVAPGDRIAQLVILPFLAAEFAEADALDETDRGAGGFGSTGVE